MSDGSSGAAPSVGGPTPASAPASAESSAEPGVAPAKGAEIKSQWSDDDDKAFFEMAKRSPYKAKIKGEERGIDSKQSLQDLLNHAQRGIGANKVVEETRKEAAEAKRLKEEATQERELFARARKGDFEARKALGMVPLDEIRKRESEWEAVPPEVRQLYEEHNKTKAELQRVQQQREQEQAEIAGRREASELGAAKRIALDSTHGIMDSLGLTRENGERFLPYVAGAIGDLGEAGLELGVDMTPELIMERVKQRIGALDEQHFSGLRTDRAMAHIIPRLELADDSQILQLFPQTLQARISKLYAMQVRGRRTQSSAPQQQPQREERRPEPPKVLSPFRFKGF